MGFKTGARGALLVLLLLVAACAPPGEPGPWHRPSGLVTPLAERDFATYLEEARARIAEGGAATGLPLDPEIVDARAPFEMAPPDHCRREDGRYARGALLIHGIGGSPYTLRDIGRSLADACTLVRAILLPGHGTVPGDLLEVDWRDWLEASHRGLASFAGVTDEVVLVGYADGGALALHLAQQEALPERIELGGLALIAPTLATRSRLAGLGGARLLYADLLPTARWSRIYPERDPVRYQSLPTNALVQRERLAAALEETGGVLDLPVFLVLSAEDEVVDAPAVRRWFCRRLIGPRRLIWYSRTGEAVDDCRHVTVRQSGEAPGILDYGHAALPIAPANPRYGRDGSHRGCRHYYHEDSPNWLLCADPGKTPANAEIRYGAVSDENLERWVVRRLTWNPDFASMMVDLLAFLDAAAEQRRAPRPTPPRPGAAS